MLRTLLWADKALKLVDQTRLPYSEEYISCHNHEEVAAAIRQMRVRGAPAIGAAAAYGVALAAQNGVKKGETALSAKIREASEMLKNARPTAVNLFWAVDRMLAKLRDLEECPPEKIADELLAEAHRICDEDLAANRRLGEFGNNLIPPVASILTHCNAGALATAGYGTALGVIRAAHEAGKSLHVYVDETRPLLQGARLTAWELMQEGIPATLITDSMAGYLMQQGKVDLVIVGADRVAGNGDTANKIGTYTLAVLASYHRVPFYVALPSSTLDLSIASGASIPIELRDQAEVYCYGGHRTAPEGIQAYNPAFDVTPGQLITAFITDRGVVLPPFESGLRPGSGTTGMLKKMMGEGKGCNGNHSG